MQVRYPTSRAIWQNTRLHEANRQATALIQARLAQGHGYNQIAQELESLGFRTRRGCCFTHKQVQRLAQRATTGLQRLPNNVC